MLEVSHLSKSFGSTLAISDISFSLRPGEIVGLLGPNGAGKTTTMRAIAGFITPDSGTVKLGDALQSDNPILLKSQIGYMPENNPLYKEMLVSELLHFVGRLRFTNQKEVDESIKFAASATNITNVIHQPVSSLSKGYRQRVGLALALLSKPKVLILDEPTEGLDPNQRDEIRKLIKTLSKSRCIMISSHVLTEIEALCSRVIILSKGQLIADGKLDQIQSSADSAQILEVTLEGEKVLSSLKSLKRVQKIETVSSQNHKYDLKLFLDANAQIEPDLSRLAAKNKWTIWHIHRTDHRLENVFRSLTK